MYFQDSGFKIYKGVYIMLKELQSPFFAWNVLNISTLEFALFLLTLTVNLETYSSWVYKDHSYFFFLLHITYYYNVWI